VERLDKKAREARAGLDDVVKRAKETKTAWEKLRDDYTSKTSDFASVAVEE
jgi:hypothetical protein